MPVEIGRLLGKYPVEVAGHKLRENFRLSDTSNQRESRNHLWHLLRSSCHCNKKENVLAIFFVFFVILSNSGLRTYTHKRVCKYTLHVQLHANMLGGILYDDVF